MTEHVYVEMRIEQFFPRCGCGWLSPTPTSQEATARELWRTHVLNTHDYVSSGNPPR